MANYNILTESENERLKKIAISLYREGGIVKEITDHAPSSSLKRMKAYFDSVEVSMLDYNIFCMSLYPEYLMRVYIEYDKRAKYIYGHQDRFVGYKSQDWEFMDNEEKRLLIRDLKKKSYSMEQLESKGYVFNTTELGEFDSIPKIKTKEIFRLINDQCNSRGWVHNFGQSNCFHYNRNKGYEEKLTFQWNQPKQILYYKIVFFIDDAIKQIPINMETFFGLGTGRWDVISIIKIKEQLSLLQREIECWTNLIKESLD